MTEYLSPFFQTIHKFPKMIQKRENEKKTTTIKSHVAHITVGDRFQETYFKNENISMHLSDKGIISDTISPCCYAIENVYENENQQN